MEKNMYFSWFFLLMAIIHQSVSARIFNDQSQPLHDTHHPITFFMRDVLSRSNHHLWTPRTTQINNQLPFPKPLGLFPPNGGIPLPESNPTLPFTAIDLSGIGLSFPVMVATLHDLELGTVTAIDEDLMESPMLGSSLLGKAQGVYVASSDDGSSHMMAMTVMFANADFKDSLRFFGVHQNVVAESHISVVGGTGKFLGANGYATCKTLDCEV